MVHTTRIDSEGRVEIPKTMRDELGLEPDMALTIELRNGMIEIGPKPMEVRLVRKGHVLVAEPVHPVPTLSAETVEEIRERLRDRR